MNRAEPDFRERTVSEEETEAFLDELFTSLFDNDDISSDSDEIPNV
jgi:hypothetical protein